MLLALARQNAQRMARASSALLARNESLDTRVALLTARKRGEAEMGWEAPGLAVPQWLLLGVDRKDGRGVRVYASGSLASATFGMTPQDDPPPRFQVRAVLGETLVIDKPTYHEGIEHWLATMRNRGDSPLTR
jgi:hypothetical protein